MTGDPLLPSSQSSLKLTTRQHTTRTNSVSSGEDGDGVTCPRCLMLANGKRVLKCDICHEAYHQRCTAMAAKTFDKMISSINTTGWVCDECKETARSQYARLNAAIAYLTEQLSAMSEELSTIKSAITSPQAEQPTAETGKGEAASNNNSSSSDAETEIASQTVRLIHRTINDSIRRKSNIIVSGIPESDTADDRSTFLQICEDHLSVRPFVAEGDCVRIGKKLPNKPRRLLIKLRSTETTDNILRKAPALRNSSDRYVASNIFLTSTMDPLMYAVTAR